MADLRQLAILRIGPAPVSSWNQWRQEHSDMPVDLSGADLSGARLNDANLCGANLGGARLFEASLRSADMRGAQLYSTDLRLADLTEAKLAAARFSALPSPTSLWQVPPGVVEGTIVDADAASSEEISRTLALQGTLADVTLVAADLTQAQLDHMLIRGAVMHHVCLVDANLSGSSLVGVDLCNADLTGADLAGAIFRDVQMREICLREANLRRADLRGADLRGADLWGADLSQANLSRCQLAEADLSHANLRETDLHGVDLARANLSGAVLLETNLRGSNMEGCTVYGVSVWNAHVSDSVQRNLRITRPDEPAITVDTLHVGQFLYMMLQDRYIRHALETVSSRIVLLTGRYTPERRATLDAVRDVLRHHPQGYIPVLFDFNKPNSKEMLEMVTSLAGLSRFVLIDLADTSMERVALPMMVAAAPSVPIQPLLQDGTLQLTEADSYAKCAWVLPLLRYRDFHELLARLNEHVLSPIEAQLAQGISWSPARVG